MGVSAVLDPSAFNETYFTFNKTHRIDAEDFLKSIERDGLLIVDSGKKLQDAFVKRVYSVPAWKQSQILVEELLKNRRKRVVECCVLSNYTSSRNILDLAYHVRTVSQADTLIVSSESLKTLKSDQRYDEDIVLLSGHHDSDFEKFYQRYYDRSESIDILSQSEIEDTIIYSAQFSNWLAFIVNEEIFASREKLVTLLERESSYEVLEQEFREFFNGYYALALELEEHEESILRVIKETDALAYLKYRVSAVEAQRKSSPLGREARRMGMSIHGDPIPEIKVAALSPDEFRTLMHTLGNWRLFVLRERLVRLMETDDSIEMVERLRAEFCEFFVCYLELELFLENYDYDPDEGLELRPEFIEELEREDEYIQSGGKMFTLEEVAKELGVKLECVS